MNWFHFRWRNLLLFGLGVLLPLLSINMEQRPFDTGWYNQPLQWVAGLSQHGLFFFSDGIRGTTSEYLNLLNIKTENKKLQSEIKDLKARMLLFDELELENLRLNNLLDFKGKTKMDMVAAKVISRDLLTDHSTLRINKGSHHGLQQGQAVITTEGVVGYVFRPEAFSSLVLLVTDRYAVVDGVLSRSRARGIVEGKSPTSCALRYVERNEDVKVGDLVVTSGLDNIFPKGFPVAVVESVESKTFSVSLRVDLRPVVDPDKVEEVFIIINAAHEDFGNRFISQFVNGTDGVKELKAE